MQAHGPLTKFELLFYHVQLCGCIALSGLLPGRVADLLRWTSATLLDVRAGLFDDFRTQYLLTGAFAPLLISALIVLNLNRLRVTLWMGLAFTGLVFLAAGAIQYALPYSPYVEDTLARRFLFVGLGAVGLAVLIVVVSALRKGKRRRALRTLRKHMSELERVYFLWYRKERQYVQPRSVAWFAIMIFAITVLVIGILAMAYIVNELTSSVRLLDGPIRSMSILVRIVFAFIVACLGLHVFLLSFLRGRIWSYGAVTLLKQKFVPVILVVAHMLYLPTVNTAMATFFCTEVQCPDGQVFPTRVYYALIETRALAEEADVCVDCLFTEDCPEYLDICYSEQDSRLLVDPSLSCTFDILPYYSGLSFLLLAVLGLGLPITSFWITRIAHRTINLVGVPVHDPQLAWFLKTGVSRASCRHMFVAFKHPFRQFRFASFMHHAVVAYACLLALLHPRPAVLLLVVAQALKFLFTLHRPFQREVTSGIEIGVSAFHIGVASLAAAHEFVDGGVYDEADDTTAALVLIAFALAPGIGILGGNLLVVLRARRTAAISHYTDVPIANRTDRIAVLRRTLLKRLLELRERFRHHHRNAVVSVVQAQEVEERMDMCRHARLAAIAREHEKRVKAERRAAAKSKDANVLLGPESAGPSGRPQPLAYAGAASAAVVHQATPPAKRLAPLATKSPASGSDELAQARQVLGDIPPLVPLGDLAHSRVWHRQWSEADEDRGEELNFSIGHDERRGVTPEMKARAALLIQRVVRGHHTREMLAVGKTFQAADLAIDTRTLGVLRGYAIITAFVTVCTMTACVVAILQSTQAAKFVPHEPMTTNHSVDYMYRHELLDNDDWEMFASECCCIEDASSDAYPVAELWKCSNGMTKQKARIEIVNGVMHNGTMLRDVCSREMAPGVCQPFHEDGLVGDSSFPFFTTEICDSSLFAGEMPSEHARKRLW